MAQPHDNSAAGEALAQTLLAASTGINDGAARCLAERLFNWQPASVPVTLQALAAELQQDEALQQILGVLRWRFLTRPETQLPEHGCAAPVGFAISGALSDLLIHYCAAPGQLPLREAADAREQHLQAVQQLWRGFTTGFRRLAESDALFRWPGCDQLLLQSIWHDALGYSGAALIRRSLSATTLSDFSGIDDEEMRNACLHSALALGRTLMLAADHIADEEALVARIRQAA
ncbi:hypothetical protein [Pantoea eucrina]|uniref:hypothetical protein n=1 Tax=Pantoea eucrina TaxID=472693 RepID=UPI00080F5824|nr:hypothetical protein [Pantoea eucrina]